MYENILQWLIFASFILGIGVIAFLNGKVNRLSDAVSEVRTDMGDLRSMLIDSPDDPPSAKWVEVV